MDVVQPKPAPNRTPTTAVMAMEMSGDFRKMLLRTNATTIATRIIDVLMYMDMNVALLHTPPLSD